jgi:NADPH:quinone reductase-like Zn-dependent oxidoreductase
MKAFVCDNQASPDVLQFIEIEKPVPSDVQVLVKIRAASVNPMDDFPVFLARTSRRMGKMAKPKLTPLGTDLAGQVEAVGENVTLFKPGDEVFGAGNGAFAEYVCTNEKNLALKPSNLSFEDAAAVPVAGLTALQALRDHGVLKSGQKVLIDGASGGVGTFAVQIARALGAEVSAVCSPRNLERAVSLGAQQVIDYTSEDFTRSGLRYDLIVAANGYHSIFDYRRSLSKDGTFVMVGGARTRILQANLLGRVLNLFGRRKVRFFVARINHPDLAVLKDMIEAGKVMPVIDRRYPLSALAEAMQYRGEGHAQGKVVVIVDDPG